MGFTKHECCTNVHFSGMISIRLETCKPFSSSKPQNTDKYQQMHVVHGATNEHGLKCRQQIATTISRNNVQYYTIFICWQTVGRNSEHSTNMQISSILQSQLDLKCIESTCYRMLWSCLMKKKRTEWPANEAIASVDLWIRAYNFIMFLAEIDKGLSVLWLLKCVYNRVIAFSNANCKNAL